MLKAGEWAVWIVEGQPLNVRREMLPTEVRQGHHLEVVVEGGQVVSAVIDEVETLSALQWIRAKQERVRKGSIWTRMIFSVRYCHLISIDQRGSRIHYRSLMR